MLVDVAVADVGAKSKRPKDADPQYDPCCPKYKAGTLKQNNIDKDIKLAGLLQMHVSMKPMKLRDTLCAEGFHTKCREITNYRSREKAKAQVSSQMQCD